MSCQKFVRSAFWSATSTRRFALPYRGRSIKRLIPYNVAGGQLDVRMPQEHLNKVRTYALHREYRGAAVPQIGEADVVRSVCWRSGSKFRRSVLEGYTGRKRVDV
jgi:hypothetical protein